MRKQFDGLSAMVKHQLKEDPLSGQLFVFINRRRTQMKILYFDRSGYCIWSKRLVQGQFNYRPSTAGKLALDWLQLKLLIDGIEIEKQRQYKRFDRDRRGP
ncbi:MAG: IS66 family insertion sequence element accessory protein TnpB [Gammaproteobacteria bacterium]|nr:IS66 family insertion sequence element accessory protein TnpB [Gammaproteobacteria bacterium]